MDKIKTTVPEVEAQERPIKQRRVSYTRYPYLAYVSDDGWVHRVPLDGETTKKLGLIRGSLLWVLRLLVDIWIAADTRFR